jgi:predicted ATP-dependent protease
VLDQGVWRSDFTMIRAGSLLRANGGYLVFNLLDASLEPAVWPTLKRVLKNMRAEISSQDPMGGFLGASIKPEPVELKIKVVLIGDSVSYQMLYDHDDEFRKIFKVKADFDSSMPRDRRSSYTRFVATPVARPPAFVPGVAAVLETGAPRRPADKLSTRFSTSPTSSARLLGVKEAPCRESTSIAPCAAASSASTSSKPSSRRPSTAVRCSSICAAGRSAR